MDEPAPAAMLESLAAFIQKIPDKELMKECAGFLADHETPAMMHVLWVSHLLNGRKLVLMNHTDALNDWEEMLADLETDT